MGDGLPGKVRTCFGQSVRAVRDPPDHRLALLRAATRCNRSRLAALIGASALLQLSAQLVSGLMDPLSPSGAITQTGRTDRASARSVSSESATMPAARWSNHSLPRLASIEAFAGILVPSIATVPNLPKPAFAAIINT
jgi:hypothetical protein